MNRKDTTYGECPKCNGDNVFRILYTRVNKENVYLCCGCFKSVGEKDIAIQAIVKEPTERGKKTLRSKLKLPEN